MSTKPALSASEWKNEYAERWDKGSDQGVYPDGSVAERGWTVMRAAGQVFVGAGEKGPPCIVGLTPSADHALAALCLHGQEFGFTQEMLRIIRDPEHPEFLHWVDIVAGVVEALLPPEADNDGV